MILPKIKKFFLAIVIFITLVPLVPQVSHAQTYQNYTIIANGTQFSIPYALNEGKVSSMTLDSQEKAISVDIQSDTKGNLTINLPRILIDATENGDSSHYVVLLNGHGVGYKEVISASSRDLTVLYPSGNNDIEIKGTQAIPEFGSAVPYIFMASVLMTVLIFRHKFLRNFR